jgi:hypothetical protein
MQTTIKHHAQTIQTTTRVMHTLLEKYPIAGKVRKIFMERVGLG